MNRWDLQNKVQESQEKELKKEIRLQRRKLKRIKTARNMYPEFESLSDEEVLIQKKIKDDEKNRLINKTKKKTKLKIMNKEPTSESIEYWRKKWGITKASLEEDEEVSSS